MNTSPLSVSGRLARAGLLGAALLSTLGTLSFAAASTPAPMTKKQGAAQTPATPPPPSDPYAAYLTEVAKESDECKTHVEKLQALLKEQTELIPQTAATGAGAEPQALPRIEELNQEITDTEAALRQCHEKNTPAEPPPMAEPTPPVTASGKPIDPEKIKETYYPPVPVPAAIEVPPATEAENAYVAFLAARAAGAQFVGDLTEDLRRLLEQRRETAVRFLAGDERDRFFLSRQIDVINQRIAETAHGLLVAAQESEDVSTADKS